MVSSTPVQDIHRFLEGYKNLVDSLETKHVAADILVYTQLLSGWQMLQHLSAKYQRQHARDYNIFWLLKNLYRDETRLHSPFLADLLNPNGTHQQGLLFYEVFLQQLSARGLSMTPYKVQDPHFMRVETEIPTGNLTGHGDGFIDVLLTYQAPEGSFSIAIENKIYAGDQNKQLERYHAYLQRYFPQRSLLLYLTPQPKCPPNKDSISTERRQELEEKGQLLCLSYKCEITDWLTQTLWQIEAPVVRSMVTQYRQVIAAL